MGYPDAPNWRGAGPSDAWFKGTFNGTQRAFASSGRGMIGLLQRRLSIRVDGAWGPQTQDALIAAFQRAGTAGASTVAALQRDKDSRVLHGTSIMAAAYLITGASPEVPLESIVIPSQTVAPVWLGAPGGATSDPFGVLDVATGQVVGGSLGVPAGGGSAGGGSAGGGSVVTTRSGSTGAAAADDNTLLYGIAAALALLAAAAAMSSSKSTRRRARGTR